MCVIKWPLLFLGIGAIAVGALLLLGARRLQLEGAQERAPLVGGLISLGMGGIAFGASFVVGGC
ncbi:MAG: hypothetical protein N2047_04180 [Meiothermus sp.]|nr:hypothetical protein [Meiothermus sp.]